MKPLLLSILLLILYSMALQTAAQTPLQSPLSAQLFSSGYEDPLDIKNCGDSRLFIVEKAGKIWICDSVGNRSATPFLDITFKVASYYTSQGLLGMAFDPDYQNNGFFYVNYTGLNGGSVLGRYQVSATDPNKADGKSFKVILKQPQPATSHNGGNIVFGTDGYLYTTFGDGGEVGDPNNYSQRKSSLLGKILRLDVSTLPATFPPDNPYVGVAGLDHIWSSGLRHPWRFTFDELTGDLWIGDVGNNTWEEVDFEPADASGLINYGWHCYEGFEVDDTSDCDLSTDFVEPLFVFAHDTYLNDCSVTGGYVYRGANSGFLYGNYLFSDYCSGVLRMISSDGNGGWLLDSLDIFDERIVTFGQDQNSELYFASIYDGEIFKLVDTSNTLAGKITVSDEATADCSGRRPVLLAPKGKNLRYEWLLNQTVVATTMENRFVPAVSGEYEMVIKSPDGRSARSQKVTVDVNQRKLPLIAAASDDLFTDGRPVLLSAYPKGGTFTSASGIAGRWFDPGKALTGDNVINYTIIDELGCKYSIDRSIKVRNRDIDPENINATAGMRLYPNPASQTVTVEFAADEPIGASIFIHDATGRLLLSETKKMVAGKNTCSIPVAGLIPGFYQVSIKTSQSIQSLPLVVE
jgi:glucose/arabinose dehydrogenase